MKKIITWTSLILAASLFAETGDDKGQLKRSMKVVPLSSIYLSTENGGTKHASIVLADGVGIYTTQEDEHAKAISYLNGKYGEDAFKKDETSLKEHVLEKGTDADKELAALLLPNTGGGGKEESCDDGDPKTSDEYINGVCVSTPIKESNTVTCKDKNPGDTFVHTDGVEYLVVDDTTIRKKASLNRAETLCTSHVTDMNKLFGDLGSEAGNRFGDFNGDISKWDTSSVTTMYAMFASNPEFNQDISGWDTSNVEYMSFMFSMAKSFNQDISGWNTSKVEDYDYFATYWMSGVTESPLTGANAPSKDGVKFPTSK